MSGAEQRGPLSEAPPRVLIVEPDPVMAMALHDECVRLGLEPKLCLGPHGLPGCPGLTGEPCGRSERVDASFVTVETEEAVRAAASCAGGARLVVSVPRSLLSAVTGRVGVDRHLPSPYDPRDAAIALFDLAGQPRAG